MERGEVWRERVASEKCVLIMAKGHTHTHTHTDTQIVCANQDPGEKRPPFPPPMNISLLEVLLLM